MVRKRIGERVEAGEPLMELHLARADAALAARAAGIFTIADAAEPRPLVLATID
jgi:thymidine phosphorylase